MTENRQRDHSDARPAALVTLAIDGKRHAVTLAQALNLADGLMQKSRPRDAEAVFRAAVAAAPGSAQAHYGLASVLKAQGRLDDAIAAYEHAEALKPDLPDLALRIGTLHHMKGDLQRAAGRYRAVLERTPDQADALNNLGRALIDLNEAEQAVAPLRRATEIRKGYVVAHTNLGDALRLTGDETGAEAQYRRAVALAPQSAGALNALGAYLVERRALGEAAKVLAEAARLAPGVPQIHYNLGNLALEQGNDAIAESDFRRAIAANAGFAPAHMNLAVALQNQDRLTDALATVDRALQLTPNSAEAHAVRGTVLDSMGRREEAAEAHGRTYAIEPKRIGALALAVHDRFHCCAWDGTGEHTAALLSRPAEGNETIPPFILLSLPATPVDQLGVARHYVGRQFRGSAAPAPPSPLPIERIRVGYLSADFRNHAIAHLLTEVLELHDRTRFAVTAYSTSPDDGGAYRRRIEQAVENFRNVRAMPAEAAAARIRADGIDVLVDLMGHTQHSRLGILALRPAPVQAHYLAYPGTMGAPFIDYLIADPYVAPPEEHGNFSEKLVLLPDTYQANDRKRPRPGQPPDRANLGLPTDAFVFCCFNNAFKINPAVFDTWMRVLSAVPGSVLWLLRANAPMARNLPREAARRGVDSARLVFAPFAPLEQHLARFRAANLFLDTWPYGGHTTVSEALWMGLPVLTLPGKTFASRVAASLVHAAGGDATVMGSAEDYEKEAIRLAREPDALNALKAGLAEAWCTSVLFDTPRFTRHFEKALETMVALSRRGEAPRTFSVGAA